MVTQHDIHGLFTWRTACACEAIVEEQMESYALTSKGNRLPWNEMEQAVLGLGILAQMLQTN